MRRPHIRLVTLLLFLSAALVSGQAPTAGLDRATIARIRGEATDRSQAMEHLWWLSEVYGPRATGTPALDAASQWAMKRFAEWGLANVHQERFPFGQGWTIERFSLHLVAPQTQAFIGQPRWNSPSTDGPVLSDVVHVKAASEADLAKYQGQLRGKIVVMQPVRAVRLLDGRVVLRMNEQDWTEAMAVPPAAEPAAGQAERIRAAQAFAAAVQRFLVAEGVGALLERGPRPTSRPAAATSRGRRSAWMAAPSSPATAAAAIRRPHARCRRPPLPWSTTTASSASSNGACRSGWRSTSRPGSIPRPIRPGTRSTRSRRSPAATWPHEVVVMGAHLDSYPYAGGATDNGTGSAAMIEAVRVIQALGLKPRRTIRVALWAGEEQGLLGSRAYVKRHFVDANGAPTPAHANVAAYFNLDNGTGRILGIWGQGNAGAIKLFQQWGESVSDLGWRRASPRSVTSTDHVPFDEAGIPGFQFIQERLEYNSRSHHSNMDTFDRVQADDMKQQGRWRRCSPGMPRTGPRSCPGRSSRGRDQGSGVPGIRRPRVAGTCASGTLRTRLIGS